MGDLPEHAREFPRFEVNAYVDYTGNEVLLFHRIQNISLGGVCIQTSGVEEVGTMVDLVLNFPELDASIAVTGEVVWANREPPMDMGIRYVDLDEERKDTLRKYINMVRSSAKSAEGLRERGGLRPPGPRREGPDLGKVKARLQAEAGHP